MKKYVHMRVIMSWEEICKQSNFKRISNEPGSQLLLQQLFDKLELRLRGTEERTVTEMV